MNRKSFVKSHLPLAVLLACFGLAKPSLADDVEIFIRPSVEPIPPNVIFLLNESDHMVGTVNGQTRIDMTKEAMKAIIDNEDNNNINAAIMAFGQTSAYDYSKPNTRIVKPFDHIGNNKDAWHQAIENMTASEHNYAHLALTIHGMTAATKWLARGYLEEPSPLDTVAKGNWCKPNIVVMLSDGSSFNYGYEINNIGIEDMLDTSIQRSWPPQNFMDIFNWPIKQLPYPYSGTIYAEEGELVDTLTEPLIKTWSFNGSECSSHAEEGPIYNPFDNYNYSFFDSPISINPDIFWARFNGIQGGFCVNELVTWAATHDLKSGGEWDWDSGDVSQSPETKRIQKVIFYTLNIAPNDTWFEADENTMFLTYIAQRSGGQYFTATNADELADAFQQILDEATKTVAYAYTAPTIPFNPDNAAISGEEIYVPIFEPNPHPLWYGNLKKFTISFESTDSDDPNSPKKVVIRDAHGAAVLDNGLFSESSADSWNLSSASPGKPLNGGAASHMDAQASGSRNLYTSIDENSGSTLLVDSNKIAVQNPAITDDLLNVDLLNLPDYSNSQRRAMVLNWISWAEDATLPDGNGGTVTVSHKEKMGAPIHSKPVVVRTQNENVVFITTTEGILHAINANTGDELWAYMPKDLLSTLTKSFISDWNYSKPHNPEDGTPLDGHAHTLIPEYGLDGPLMTYEHEGHRYLVMGMRRGGRNYYALDITDPLNPTFAWKIEGGSDDFPKLGQTWSKPIYATLQLHGDSEKTGVLIIGGGYDTKEDEYYVDSNQNGVYDQGENAIARSDDDMGNVIYFVDPANGQKINSGDFHGVIDSVVKGHMGNAIVADLLPVDINANGVVDRLYAADVGGRIIRVDIPDHAITALTGSGEISATVLADVNLTRSGDTYAEQDGDDYQRFFNTPEAAYFSKGGTQYLALLIGSGHQSRPLSDLVAHDRFYMIKDPNVWTAPADGDDSGSEPDYPDVIAENDLYDTTANQVQVGSSGEQAQAASDIAASHGWYFDLNNGEKVFSPAKVYDYAVLFTTYEGISPSTDDPCEAVYSQGISRFYAVNMTNGSAMFAEMNGQSGIQTSDRSRIINTPGLPSTPYILTPANTDENGNPKLSGDILAMVGLQEVMRWPDRFHPISWEETSGENNTDTPPACN